MVDIILNATDLELDNVKFLVRLFQNFVGGSWHPHYTVKFAQRPSELAKVLIWTKKFRIASYLEIGAWKGGSFYPITAYLKRTQKDFTMAHCVDPHAIQLHWDAIKEKLPISRTVGPSGRFGQARYDLILIDGDHRYEAAKNDFERLGKLGKICMFHDIRSTNLWKDEVRLYWEKEMKAQYKDYKEFCDGNGMGFGVVFPRNFPLL